MRIVYVVTRSDSMGGSQTHVIELARAMMGDGHDVSVLIGGHGPVMQAMADYGIRCVSIPHLIGPLRPLSDLKAFLEVCKALKRLDPELVSAHTAKAGILSRAASLVLRMPVVFTAHGWSIGDRVSPLWGKFFQVIEMIAALFTDAIINVCDSERKMALRHGVGTKRKMRVVHNGVPDIDASLYSRPVETPPRLLTIARFESPKDHVTLIRALSCNQHLSWELEWIGAGPESENCRRLAAELGIEQRIRFSGARSDIASRISQAQVFVLSSRFEGFPRSILEAMRAGVSVISSDVGGVREAVIESHTGYLVPAGDVQSLASRLETVIQDENLRRAMGAAGRRRYKELFTFEEMFDKTLRVYNEVLGTSVQVPVPQELHHSTLSS